MIKNSSRPLLYSSKSNESKEGVKNKVGLRDLDVSWKDDVECEGIELRISEMDDKSKCVSVLDESCEENVEDSSEIRVNSNCLMVLDNFECDQSREREFTSFSSFHLTGSHKFVNHVGESGDLVTEIVSKGDTSVVLTTKFEKTKASIQVTQEDKEDDMVMEDETIMCLVDLGYGSDGLKVNSSVNGVLDSRIMNEFDVVMNSNKGDWTSNFNKPVDIIKECSMEQKESRNENNNLISSDIVLEFVIEYDKRKECESLSFDKGCIQNGVCLFGRCCYLKHVEGLDDDNKCAGVLDELCEENVEGLIDKEKGYEDTGCKMAICYDQLWKYEKHKEKLIRNQSGSQGTKDTSHLGILTYSLKVEQAIELIHSDVPFPCTILSNGSNEKRKMDEIGDSLFPTLWLNGLGGNGGICESEFEILGQILQWLIQNHNMMMINFGGTPTDSCNQTFTNGMDFEIKMSSLSGISLIVDSETTKMNEDSLGHLKFDILKWPKRKKKRFLRARIFSRRMELWVEIMFCWNEVVNRKVNKWTTCSKQTIYQHIEGRKVSEKKRSLELVSLVGSTEEWVCRRLNMGWFEDTACSLVTEILSTQGGVLYKVSLQWEGGSETEVEVFRN
ncbi:hypothetical protein Tco_0462480 [Tanacetum coccineum]